MIVFLKCYLEDIGKVIDKYKRSANMSEEKKWQSELEEYIRQGEPKQAQKSEAWKTAIGLQEVDGLKTSSYLLDTF